jgi:UDP-N-acetylmuramoyl-tripeptide--D-alanyl-D-alanine ligase
MRQEVHTRADGLRVIDDSYNASPESMAAALDVLFSLNCEGKRVAVLGEMGEQGDEAPRLHQLTGAYAAAKNPEILAIIGGELADQMAEGATTMGMDIGQIARYDTVKAALDALAPVLGGQDLVLVKASRSSGLDAFAKGVLAR